jgi:hypothetical protein
MQGTTKTRAGCDRSASVTIGACESPKALYMLRPAMVLLVFAQGLLQAQITAKVTGKVTDALTHQPIQNVHVAGSIGSQYVGALTGPDGSYTLDDLPAGSLNLTVNLDGYRLIIWVSDKSAQIQVAPGDVVTRDFVLHPLGRIYGKLVDRDSGDPIEGHTVFAMRKEYLPGHVSFEGNAADEKRGEFNIRNLEPGDYLIAIDSANEATIAISSAALSTNPAVTTDAALSTNPAAALSTNPAAALSTNPAAAAPSPKKYYGQRWYPDVPRSDMATLIHLAEGETRSVHISLQSRETHSLSGTVVVSGAAPREFVQQPVSFAFRPSDSSVAAPRPASQMPAPGPFRVDNIAPGTYWLAVTAGKPPNQLTGDYLVEIADHDVDGFKAVLAPEAGVTGEFRMLEKDAKLPDKLRVFMVHVSGWLVILEHGMLIGGNMPVLGAAAQAGKFRQDSIRPGEYWPVLAGLPEGYAVAQTLFEGSSPLHSTMSLSSPDTPLTFVLTARSGVVTAVVRDENQAPVRSASVVLLPDPLPDKPGPGVIRTGESGDNGALVFRDVAPGKYRAVVLSGPDLAYGSDAGYLREQAARVDGFEVRAGESVSLNLKR